MSAKTLFFSWQSDLEPKEHHYLIRDALKDALKIINKEIDFELSIDKDTERTSGSPDIVDTIFKKIRACDIFVADVTIINADYEGRKTPNPNVLIELGYAVKTLGWERIICIVNTDVCKPEDLPFDIRNNRTSRYSIKKGGIKAGKASLCETMIDAIKAIVDDYPGIIERLIKDDYFAHDKAIFKKLDVICPQIQLFEGLDFLCSTLSVNSGHYRLWRNVKIFSEALENHFLNNEIQSLFQAFVKALGSTHSFAAQKLFIRDDPDMKWEHDYTKKGIEITPEIQLEIDQSQRYCYPDFLDVRSDDNDAYAERQTKTQDTFNEKAEAAMAAYKAFRLAIKKHLLI